VRDLHREVAFPPDRDDLIDRVPERAVLASDVADVSPALGADRGSEVQHLLARRVDAGIVLEARRETDRAGVPVRQQQRSHAVDLGLGRGTAEVLPHHLHPERVVPGVGSEVDGCRDRVEPAEEILEWELGSAVLPHDDGGNPLAHVRERVAMLADPVIGMAVGVDEPGRECQARTVDEPVILVLPDIADRRDAVAQDADRPDDGAVAGSVVDGRVGDEGAGGRFTAAAGREQPAGSCQKSQGAPPPCACPPARLPARHGVAALSQRSHHLVSSL
jgi:hypothetical protein